MKIFGIGTDIVNIKRIEKFLKKNKGKVTHKIFSKNEINYCESKRNHFPFMRKDTQLKKPCQRLLVLESEKISILKILKFQTIILENPLYR